VRRSQRSCEYLTAIAVSTVVCMSARRSIQKSLRCYRWVGVNGLRFSTGRRFVVQPSWANKSNSACIVRS
jgi:hypothetical protein